jgi:hypothetical protein
MNQEVDPLSSNHKALVQTHFKLSNRKRGEREREKERERE